MPRMDGPPLFRTQRALLTDVLMDAKQVVAKALLTGNIPFAEVKCHMNWTMVNEKLTSRLQNAMPKYHKIWDPWIKAFLPTSFDHSLFNL